MYETFEHTADLGLRVRAADLNQLFIETAQALFSAIVDDLGTIELKHKIDVKLNGDDLGYLLFDWLNELLYRFDTDHMLVGKFEVRIENQKLEASAWGEPLDPSRHSLAHEVKAITYHELKVVQEKDGWLAEVIVDI
jgi:SHS2 domain-containing protein